MKISDEMFDRVAGLAKLEFKAEAREQMKKDLDNILELCEKMKEVDTEGVEPLIHMTDEVNNFRDDRAETVISKKEALKNAPDKDSDYFKVPKVIDR